MTLPTYTDAELEEFKHALTLPFEEGWLPVRNLVSATPSLVNSPEFGEWCDKHGPQIIAATERRKHEL